MAWQQERARLERRAALPDRILAYTEDLERAETRAAIDAAVAEHAARIVGAFAAVAYRQPAGSVEGPFEPVAGSHLNAPALVPAVAKGCSAPTVIGGGASAEVGWIPVLDGLGAAQVVCTPLGLDGLLVLAERRRARVLTNEDRDLLQAVVRLAQAAHRHVDRGEALNDLTRETVAREAE